jgi:HPr kinase/phosphorylase
VKASGAQGQQDIIHASAVALEGRALLILGASGSGKSTLALDLIGLGAMLVADDRTILRLSGDTLLAATPPSIAGLIEARFVGLLRLPHTGPVPVALAIDLDRAETERLPPARETAFLGRSVPLLHCPPRGTPAMVILQCLMQRRDTP